MLFEESTVPGNGSGDTGKPPRRQVNSPTMISSVSRTPVTRHEYRSKFSRSRRFLGWCFRDGHDGITGNVRRDGCRALWQMVCRAATGSASCHGSFPVLGLRSNRGKLLLETSKRTW